MADSSSADTLDHVLEREAPAPSRAERRDQQVQRILEAAKACFLRSGFQGASMHQICAEVGMSPGALYRYFPSKEAIIEAICEADRKQDAEQVRRDGRESLRGRGLRRRGDGSHPLHPRERQRAAIFAEIATEVAAQRGDPRHRRAVHGRGAGEVPRLSAGRARPRRDRSGGRARLPAADDHGDRPWPGDQRPAGAGVPYDRSKSCCAPRSRPCSGLARNQASSRSRPLESRLRARR